MIDNADLNAFAKRGTIGLVAYLGACGMEWTRIDVLHAIGAAALSVAVFWAIGQAVTTARKAAR